MIGSVELASRQLVPELVKAGGISTAIQRKVTISGHTYSPHLLTGSKDILHVTRPDRLGSTAKSQVGEAMVHCSFESRGASVLSIFT